MTVNTTSPRVQHVTNGVQDTLQSSFRVFGGATDLGFDLTQHVEMFAPGMSFIQQTYAITNNESSSVSFQMVRAFDGDLLWSGDFADDEVLYVLSCGPDEPILPDVALFYGEFPVVILFLHLHPVVWAEKFMYRRAHVPYRYRVVKITLN